MKVSVLQLENVKISKWRFWSNWVDIAVFDINCEPYLLQMKINRFNGKKFRSLKTTGFILYRQVSCKEIGDLLPINGVPNEQNTIAK